MGLQKFVAHIRLMLWILETYFATKLCNILYWSKQIFLYMIKVIYIIYCLHAQNINPYELHNKLHMQRLYKLANVMYGFVVFIQCVCGGVLEVYLGSLSLTWLKSYCSEIQHRFIPAAHIQHTILS